MNGYGIIVIVALFMIFTGLYDLGPAVKNFFLSIFDVPGLNAGRANDPVAYSFVIRITYLIAIIAILKLLIRRNG